MVTIASKSMGVAPSTNPFPLSAPFGVPGINFWVARTPTHIPTRTQIEREREKEACGDRKSKSQRDSRLTFGIRQLQPSILNSLIAILLKATETERVARVKKKTVSNLTWPHHMLLRSALCHPQSLSIVRILLCFPKAMTSLSSSDCHYSHFGGGGRIFSFLIH